MDYELIGPDETHDAGAFMSYARTRQAAKQERDPLIGDVVHFWHGAYCLAAIVLAEGLFDGLTLRVLVPQPGADREAQQVEHDEAKSLEGTWHWPCGGQ